MRRIQTVALLLTLSAVAGAVKEAPFTFRRSTPEAQGISSSAILGFIEEAEQKLDALHSIMIVRHGQVVAEGWWGPYAAEVPHMLFSLSKSFTSTAVGLAVADGKLRVDDPVLGFFPDEAPAQPSANLKAMRVRDLLTMSTGHHEEDVRDFPYTGEESVVKNFLARPVSHRPGTFFFYNTPASYAGADQRIAAAHNTWQKGTLMVGGTPNAIAASGAWTSADTYTLTVVRYRTPFATTYQLRFAGDQLFVKAEQNVGPADARVSEFVGKLATAPAQRQ